MCVYFEWKMWMHRPLINNSAKSSKSTQLSVVSYPRLVWLVINQKMLCSPRKSPGFNQFWVENGEARFRPVPLRPNLRWDKSICNTLLHTSILKIASDREGTHKCGQNSAFHLWTVNVRPFACAKEVWQDKSGNGARQTLVCWYVRLFLSLAFLSLCSLHVPQGIHKRWPEQRNRRIPNKWTKIEFNIECEKLIEPNWITISTAHICQ